MERLYRSKRSVVTSSQGASLKKPCWSGASQSSTSRSSSLALAELAARFDLRPFTPVVPCGELDDRNVRLQPKFQHPAKRLTIVIVEATVARSDSGFRIAPV